MSASPAARSVNKNNLSARLKKQGTFMRSVKKRKLFKFTLATDKEGGLTQSGESPEIGGLVHRQDV